MSEMRGTVMCPLCGSRMPMPRRGRRMILTCHNGHSFLHTVERTPHRWLTRGQFALLVTVLLMLFGLVFAHQWAGHRVGPTKSAVAGEPAPGR